MCELTHHSHEVCLATDVDGRTRVCAEWQLAFDDAPANAPVRHAGAPVRVCFCADAATLRELALTMFACADELDVIQACADLSEAGSGNPHRRAVVPWRHRAALAVAGDRE